jgi:hypothetical protein
MYVIKYSTTADFSGGFTSSFIYIYILIIVLDLKRPEQNARDGLSDTYQLAKWHILNRLYDRKETMYYKVCNFTGSHILLRTNIFLLMLFISSYGCATTLLTLLYCSLRCRCLFKVITLFNLIFIL